MKTNKLIPNFVALLSLMFTAQLRAQSFNAWQIDDHATNAPLSYSTTIPLADQEAATNLNGGWSYTVNARLVTDYGAGNQAMAMIYGDGVTRWEILWTLSGGDLQTTLFNAGGTTNITTGGLGTNYYHSHQIVYDPTNQTASYVLDGQVLVTNWTGSPAAWTAGRVFWGSVSSGGVGVMNFNSVQFAVTNNVVASYEAGTENNPTNAPDPAASGWVMSPSVPATNTSVGPINAELIVILPNAWQVADNSTGSGSTPHYSNSLSTGLQVAATNGGFRYAVNARLLLGNANPSMIMLYGLGTERFLVTFNLTGGDLTAALEGGDTYTLTTNGTGHALYHTHEIVYDATNGKASYVFDGQVKTTNWTASSTNFASGAVYWGSGSSTGQGTMNFHSVAFEVTNSVVAAYDAGHSPTNAPNPTLSGWAYDGTGLVASIPSDLVLLQAVPAVTTLAATEVRPQQATLRGTIQQGNLAATTWFEWGTDTNYGSMTPPIALLSDTNEFNLEFTLTNLTKGTEYHFRCVATNLQGITYGTDAMFTTPLSLSVTSLADNGPGSLRQAIADASPGDTITFATNGIITISSVISPSKEIMIVGPGPDLLGLSGGNITRVFSNSPTVICSVSGLTFRDGQTFNSGNAAGIYNAGVLTLSNCVVTANRTASGANAPNASSAGANGGPGSRGGEGAGINNINNLTLIACTISYNTNGNGGAGGNGGDGALGAPDGGAGGAGGRGGNGAGILSSGTLSMTNCWVLGNVAGKGGGGGNGGDGRVGFDTDGGNGGGGGNAGQGAGIYATGPVTLSGCLFQENHTLIRGAGGGGGAAGGLGSDGASGSNGAGGHGPAVSINNEALVSGNSTFTENFADSSCLGGAVYCLQGSLLVLNCTLINNSAGAGGTGGGIYKTGSAILMTNSVVALNSAGSYSNVYLTIWGANNFLDADPLLAPLGDYGGPTQTMPPLAGSLVLDVGDDSVTNSLATDQRGSARLSGVHVDIGAVEVKAAQALNPPVAITGTATDVLPHSALLQGVVISQGADTTAWFEWGVTTNYGKVTPPMFVEGDIDDLAFAQIVNETIAGVTHHYRLVVASQLGLTFGEDVAFISPINIVTSLSNSGPGTLRAALDEAVAGDTIVIATNGTITITPPSLTISQNLTLIGPGPELLSVSSGHTTRVLLNPSGVIAHISGVTIRDGNTSSSVGGAGIFNSGELTLSNCVVTANRTGNGANGASGANPGDSGGNAARGGHGAGIYSDNNLTLIDCTISYNTNGNGGLGGDGADGNVLNAGGDAGNGGNGGNGAGICSTATLSMMDCVVARNRAGGGGDGGSGGGGLQLYPAGDGGNGGNSGQGAGLWVSGPTTLIRCSIRANHTQDGGTGGLVSTLQVTSASVSGDGGYGGSGGGIFATGSLILSNCIVAGNTTGNGADGATGVPTALSSTYDGKPGAGAGNGAGVFSFADLTIIDSTITNNISGTGGAGGLGGSNPVIGARAGIGGNGGTGGNGGGIYSGSNLILMGSTIARNFSGGGGSGGRGGEVGVTEFNFNGEQGGNGGLGGKGGGIYCDGMLAMSNCLIDSNQTAGGGNGGDGGSSLANGGSGGSGGAAGDGGGFYGVGLLGMTNCLFRLNRTASGGQGGDGGSGNFTTGYSGGNGGNGGAAGRGAGSWVADSLGIIASLFHQNQTGTGGAGGSEGSGYSNGNPGVDGADGRGAGIYNNGGAVSCNNSTFTANVSPETSKGGAIYSANGTLVVASSTLVANTAGDGGGVSKSGTDILLTNTIVALNTGGDLDGSAFGPNNFIFSDPILAPLGNYGGITPTMPPLFGSPTIDAGTDSITNSLVTDQRGYPRLSGVHVDIGAVEAQKASISNPPVLNSPDVAGSGIVSLSFTNDPNLDFTLMASTNVALPLAQWLPLGFMSQGAPGEYLFIDLQATNYPTRFYQTISP